MKAQIASKKVITDKELRRYMKAISKDESFKQYEITYAKVYKYKFLMTTAVRHGVTYELFEEIKKNSPFDDNQWSTYLDVHIRTLQRYRAKKNHVFNPTLSEKIFELSEFISLGYFVFDSHEDFEIWLSTPSIALGREKPISLLDNSYGMDLVIGELNRIEHGIFV